MLPEKCPSGGSKAIKRIKTRIKAHLLHTGRFRASQERVLQGGADGADFASVGTV